MKNEFIPYEEALALKELGFDEKCLFNWVQTMKGWKLDVGQWKDISAPLYQQAFRWFRDKHKLHPEIVVQLGFKHWNAHILPHGDWLPTTAKTGWETYEEAELECLRKLIEIKNQNKEDEVE